MILSVFGNDPSDYRQLFGKGLPGGHVDQLGGCAGVQIRDDGGLIQGGSGDTLDRSLGWEIDKPHCCAGLGDEGRGGSSLSVGSLVYSTPPSLPSLGAWSLSCPSLHFLA